MPISSLTDLYIDETYPRLVQTNDTRTEFADGLGNPITFGQTPTGSLLTTASAAGNTITFTKGDGSTFPVTVSGGGGSTDTGSLLLTASVNLNTITFTKGNGATFPITVNTGSAITDYVTTASFNAFTSSAITTGSSTTTQGISGSLNITGSLGVSGTTTIRSLLGTGPAFQVLSGSSTILYAGTSVLQTRVGIRTSTPLYSFDVNGNANFTPEEHSGYLRISPGQSSTWNNPTFFQTSFGSTLMLNNAYYTASSGQFIRATNGYAAGIQLEPSLGGIELFTAPYGTAGTAFASFTSRISITNSGSVGINNTSPNYALDVSGSGNYSNGLTVTGSIVATSFTGSLQGTASWADNATTASYIAGYVQNSATSSFITNNQTGSFLTTSSFNSYTSSITSQFAGTASYATTASYALNGGVTKITAGTNITIDQSTGNVTINSTAGGGSGAGANITQSFTNQSTWTFVHGLGNQGVIIQTYDSGWNQIIPQNISSSNTTTAVITFSSPRSGYAIASLGGSTTTAQTASYVLNAVSASYTATASYVVTALTASYVTSSRIVGTVTSASYAVTASATTAFDGAWTSYTPSWSSAGTQPSIGNGTLTGAYKQIGKTVFVRVRLAFGSTTSGGTGAWQFGLPVTASIAAGIQFPCSMLDNGNAWYQAVVNGEYAGDTWRSALIAQSAGGANSSQGVDATFPFTWGNLDSLQFNGSYEAV